MPAIFVTNDVLAALTLRKTAEKPYDHVLRELLGIELPKRKQPMEDHADYLKLAALPVKGTCLLEFVRHEPPRDAEGLIPTSWDSKPTNLRHLSQVVRRVQERLGYQLFVEGRPRGQMVTRIR